MILNLSVQMERSNDRTDMPGCAEPAPAGRRSPPREVVMPVPLQRTQRPTLETVARAAAVSRQTVSNVLNAPQLVRPETRQRPATP